MRRLGALIGLALVLGATPAAAHYKDSKERWWFSGGTTGGPNSRTKIDPIDVILYPYAIRYYDQGNLGKFARANDHLGQHVRPHYGNDEDMPFSSCRGKQYVGFPARTEPRKPNNFGWMSWNSQNGPVDRCKTRYHARVWYDDNHASGGHEEPATWMIGSLHHERTNLVRFGRPVGHYIDADWDTVEAAYVQKMRAAPRNGANHLDPRGRGGGLGHCSDYRWKPLPGSRGWFGGVEDTSDRPGSRRNGYFSDGWITRISMNHCSR